MNVNFNNRDTDMEELIMKAVHKALLATQHQFIDSGWVAGIKGWCKVCWRILQHVSKVSWNGIEDL